MDSRSRRAWMTKILTRIVEILWRKDIEYAEIQGSLLPFFWGAWFFLHDRYDVCIDDDHPLLMIVQHEIWGIVFITIGSLQFFGLVMNRYKIRRIGAMLATIIWIFVGILTSRDGWLSFCSPTAFALAIGSAWGFIRIGYANKSNNLAEP